jgi:hypothetical protein
MDIIFWCEFPEQADWKAIQKILEKEKFKPEIYLGCKSRLNFETWKKKIAKECPSISKVNPWPLVELNKGYWFSGYSEMQTIDRLKEYQGLKIKIDLEPPYPKVKYTFLNMLAYGAKMCFRKGKNNLYLKHTITELGRKSFIISNEFPLPEFVLNRFGCHMDVRKHRNMIINFISYTSFVDIGRPILRWYFGRWAKYAVKKYGGKAMFSLGMLGPGIFGNEPKYKTTNELKKDLEVIKKAGAKRAAIYSIEHLTERKNPEQWIRLIKQYAD